MPVGAELDISIILHAHAENCWEKTPVTMSLSRKHQQGPAISRMEQEGEPREVDVVKKMRHKRQRSKSIHGWHLEETLRLTNVKSNLKINRL
jgi:hypothetical protein